MALVDVIIGYAKGAQGDVGPQGQTGPQGPEGPQGPLPPLINNALATEAGVAALDAAMGKTLQDQITQTNSNLIDGEDWISTTYFWYKKKGKTVYLKRNGMPTVTANVEFAFGTLPLGYRPSASVFRSVSNVEASEWVHRYFNIGTDGTITLGTSKNSTFIPSFQISFIID